ncbi:MAG: NUDIX hydrolase [Cyanobacteria bacterium P01_F01_bin.4]
MSNDKKWQILRSHLAFDHPWYKVRQDVVKLPNGQVIDDYFVSVRPDVALVLPITPQAEIVFVYQYRHGAQAVLLELPAGTFDPHTEKAEVAALRELEEETGYTTDTLIPLSTLYDNPVKETNQIHLFLAKDVSQSTTQKLDVTEDIDVVRVPIAEIHERIRAREIQVAGTLAAIYLGLAYLNKGQGEGEKAKGGGA